MKYEYNDEKPQQLLEKGEYVLEVTKADFGVSDGAKSKGCHNVKLTLVDEVNGVELQNTFTFPDDSVASGTAKFFRSQIDSFLKSTGFAKEKGQNVEITPETLVGLRTWALVIQESWESKDKTKKGVNNKIEAWILKPLPERPF